MPHKSNKESKKKTKSRKHRHHTKISQKVIQKVIVKIGEERKAKKARRRQKRHYKREAEDAILQQPSAPPTIVYNTGGAYQPLQYGQTVITPQQKKPVAEYVDIEQPSGIIEIPTKKEQLAEFIDPVAPPVSQENVGARIFTEKGLNPEKVDGNYSFGEPDVFNERPPTSLSDNELSFQPRFVAKSIGENLNQIGKPLMPIEGSLFDLVAELLPEKEIVKGEGYQKPKRRTKDEIAVSRYRELHALLLKDGYSESTANDYIDNTPSQKLPDEIKKVKADIKAKKGIGKIKKITESMKV
jgi:hypothetical protein